MLSALVLAGLTAAPAVTRPAALRPKLVVISVDGLDWRYLRDRDSLRLAIPTLRRLLKDAKVADGVIGVWPTITWPSHTSIITGVRPDQHGILGNAQRGAPFNESYWSVTALKARTLWQCAGDAGLTTAAVTWPVTIGAKITYNLPEAAMRRNGGSMDLDSVAATATPGLVDAIARLYPSFPQQWVDDRTRTLAVLYLLRAKQPDLILAHLVDLDSEEHDQGPFGTNAKAILERTDALIGQILAGLPKGYRLVITSDHGFERIDKVANLAVLVQQAGIKGEVRSMGGMATTADPTVADYLRGFPLAAGPTSGERSRARSLSNMRRRSRASPRRSNRRTMSCSRGDQRPVRDSTARKGRARLLADPSRLSQRLPALWRRYWSLASAANDRP